MADRVQYIIDGMAKPLREVEEMEIFQPNEIRSIVKQRTDREYILMRRKLEPRNFADYIEYERKLEKLLAIRVNRRARTASKDEVDSMRRLQGVFFKHVCYIFDRAVRRFSQVRGLWNRYFAYLKEKNAPKLLNKAYGRVLALYPKQESYWLDAAMHELRTNNNAQAARILMQRALRANKKSKVLYLKYFELEVWYVLRGLRRKSVLGLKEERSPRDVFAVPLVVFKYATDAVHDPAFAFHMHSLCREVATDLADLLMASFETSYSGDPAYWRYLCSIQETKMARLIASYGSSKLFVPTAAGPLALMTELTSMVIRGLEAVGQASLSAGDKCVFALSMGYTLQEYSWAMLEALGMCAVGRAQRGYSPEELPDITTLRAAMGQALTLCAASAGDSADDDVYGHQALCNEALLMLEQMALPGTLDRYHFSLRSPLLVWLKAQQPDMEAAAAAAASAAAMSGPSTGGDTDLDEFTWRKVSAWVCAADRALMLSRRSWGDALLSTSRQDEQCDARKRILTEQARAAASVSEVLVATEEGSRLLTACIDALVVCDEVGTALDCAARAMKATCCAPENRGVWWERFLKLSMSVLGWEAVASAVKEANTFFQAKPLLKTGTNMSAFFEAATRTLLTMLRAQKRYNFGVDSALVAALRMVSQSALDWYDGGVKHSGGEHFIDYAAEFHMLVGNHRAANDLRERRNLVSGQ